MKLYLAALFVLISAASYARQDDTIAATPQPVYKRHSIIATASTGFIDPFRNYSVPAGFEKDNTSGYTLLYGKLEYGFTEHISLAATIKYDAFYYNFAQLY